MNARWAGPLAAVALALAAAVVTGQRGGDDGPSSDAGSAGSAELPATGEELVAVSSDAPRHRSLDELVAASDLVVRGEVEGTERGRPFGQPGGATIVSRLVTLRVDEVLAGPAPRAGTVLVEEEGWLDDGRALVVDGARPSEAGDTGIWFLTEVDDPDLPVYTTVGAEGRYLVAGDGDDALVGADGDDPLVAELAARGPDGLAAAVRAG
ncbi:MAG TPA: hypothetical protein VGO78_23210 [Acidimicrobiales bacterium]|nr:hypothetical protein [Acidimicrobiales bacterium]